MNSTDKKTSLLFSAVHGDYLEELHQQYQQNPENLSPDWQAFFYELENHSSPVLPDTSARPLLKNSTQVFPSDALKSKPLESGSLESERSMSIPLELGALESVQLEKELAVYRLIDAYRKHGHLQAHLNPLGHLYNQPSPSLSSPSPSPSDSNSSSPSSEQLALGQFGLNEEDLNKEFHMGSILGLKKAPLEKILHFLTQTYCNHLALQVHESSPSIQHWFFKQFERETFQLSKAEKIFFFRSLTQTESLEKFLHTRFVGQKRFSIEGAEVLIPMLEFLCQKATQPPDPSPSESTGLTSPASPFVPIREMVIGMAHRGRINVLNNFMEKALEITLAGFAGYEQQEEKVENWENDVKYHLGFSSDKKTPSGMCHISLAFNPSHLESVNAVALGMARAKQRKHKDTVERKKILPLLIHGDAAFAGQGVVAETLQLSQLKGYTVGGTIHIVIDNQVGFTTSPQDGRSSPYASDMMKIIQAPVLHVNADDPEACLRAIQMAFDYRSTYGKDILINLMSYRRYGHNEGDEPAFTQPLMYKGIRQHPSVRELYGKQLLEEGVLNQEAMYQLYEKSKTHLQNTLDKVKKKPPTLQPLAFEGLWQGLRRSQSRDFEKRVNTQVPAKNLKAMTKTLSTWPKNFSPHPKLQKILQQRQQLLDQKQEVDWAMGELLAYASLLEEGFSVRLSGQDSVRGTFSHRHALFTDYKTEEVFNPFNVIGAAKGTEFCVYNSPLSEVAVLGFEYGNSIVDPTFLTLWEAQFGDFCNGAQVIIDQFISSGESKWQRMNGLVLLLPHGYEGMGPEHSSARLERFLSLCAQDNMQVCYLTTPAQIFHVLRRQMKRDFRKPLVIMSPKSLLRHPKVRSPLKTLVEGSFEEILLETGEAITGTKSIEAETKTGTKTGTKKQISPQVQRQVQYLSSLRQIFFCSGKIYYELLEEKEKLPPKQQAQIGLVRFEQLYPFPRKQVLQLLHDSSQLEKIHWVQEEPKNMGAWPFILSCWQEMKEREREETQGMQKVQAVQAIQARQKAGKGKKPSLQTQKSSQRKLFNLPLNYIGRESKASPATGSSRRHREEQQKVIQQCFKTFQKQPKKRGSL